MVHWGLRPLNGNLRRILMVQKEFHSELDPEPDQNRIRNTSKKRPRAKSGANMAPTWRTEHKVLVHLARRTLSQGTTSKNLQQDMKACWFNTPGAAKAVRRILDPRASPKDH